MERPKIEINIHNLIGAMNVYDQKVSTEKLKEEVEKKIIAALNVAGQSAWMIVPSRDKVEIQRDLNKVADELDGLISESNKIGMEV